jgi:hypothetical protein
MLEQLAYGLLKPKKVGGRSIVQQFMREEPGIYSYAISSSEEHSQDIVVFTTPTNLHYLKSAREKILFLSDGLITKGKESMRDVFPGEVIRLKPKVNCKLRPLRGRNIETIVTTVPKFDPNDCVEVDSYQMTPEELEIEERALRTHVVPRTEKWRTPLTFKEA